MQCRPPLGACDFFLPVSNSANSGSCASLSRILLLPIPCRQEGLLSLAPSSNFPVPAVVLLSWPMVSLTVTGSVVGRSAASREGDSSTTRKLFTYSEIKVPEQAMCQVSTAHCTQRMPFDPDHSGLGKVRIVVPVRLAQQLGERSSADHRR
jgi:hypothetical protein